MDEEIGEFDISVVPEEMVKSWDVFWTLDGERFGTVDIGCLICNKVWVTFTGMSAHPGVSPEKLIPAHYAAAVFAGNLARMDNTPMNTSGLDPFFYFGMIEGGAGKAKVLCMPRSFDTDEMTAMIATLEEKARACADEFGTTVKITVDDICINTRPTLEKNMHLLQPAIDALQALGYPGSLEDVRGGTDGAMINRTYPDLPAPNLGTCCKNLHGPLEFAVVKELELLPQLVIDMIGRYKGVPKTA